MRRREDFTATTRHGARARAGALVVHHLVPPDADAADLPGAPFGRDDPALVGLVVARSVGGSVVRHRVSRRLRARCAAVLQQLPPGSRTVVRALPEAADLPSARLDLDLRAALSRLQRPRRAGAAARRPAGSRT